MPVKVDSLSLRDCLVCQRLSARYFCDKNNYQLYRCGSCGLIFVSEFKVDTSPVYSDDYFAGAKNGFGYINYDEDKEPMREVFNDYLKRIEQLVANGSLLDVGAATGYFLKLAQLRGWQVKGVEISPFAAEIGKKKGLDITVGTLADVVLDKPFDVITLWDVLEHVPHPEQELQRIFHYVRPGGIVAINTPDSSSWVAKVSGQRWHQLIPPEHLFYFNPQCLALLLERVGFKVLASTKIGKKFTLQYIIKTTAHWLNLEKGKRLAEKLKNTSVGNMRLPLNLRDNFFLLATRQ